MMKRLISTIGLLALLLGAATANGQPEQGPQGTAADEAPAAPPQAIQPERVKALERDAKALQSSFQQLQKTVKQLTDDKKRSDRRAVELAKQLEMLENVTTEIISSGEPEKIFSIYGFFDLNFRKLWIPDNVVLGDVLDQEPSFVFGSLNTYLDFKPSPDWRVLAEIRFLLNPIGDLETWEFKLLGTSYRRVNTGTSDAAAFSERFDYGSIEIERALAVWRRYQWLKVAAGLFLTPYGIWNIDHGSPTRMMVIAPFHYALQVFPERQLGVKVFGDVMLGQYGLEYALTLSNGRGPANTLKDSDWDKAVGGRLALRSAGKYTWKAGLSIYSGDFSDSKQVAELLPDMKSLDIDRVLTIRYRELALGADFSFTGGPFTLHWELLVNWRNYDDDHRPPAQYHTTSRFAAGIDTPYGQTAEADFVFWGTGIFIGYKLPTQLVNLTPYVSVNWTDVNDNTPYERVFGLNTGLNWRISDATVLKLEHMWGYWPNKRDPPQIMSGSGDIHILVTQLATAF